MKTQTNLIACHECDLLIEMPKQLGHKEKLYCPRCKHHLATGHKQAVDVIVAVGFASLLMLVLANVYDFISINAQGQTAKMTLFEAVVHLNNYGYVLLGLVFFAFAVVFPAVYILLMMILALPLLSPACLAKPSVVAVREKHKAPPSYRVTVAKLITQLLPWSMSDVFIVGVLVSLIKVIDLAHVILGVAFWSYILFTLGFVICVTLTDNKRIWEWVYYDQHTTKKNTTNDAQPSPNTPNFSKPIKPKATPYSPNSAGSHGLVSCHVCQKLFAQHEHQCDRCGSSLHVRNINSLDMTMALLITAVILYIPANIFPMMINNQLGAKDAHTIIGGVLLFLESGSYFVAGVIFFASIVIPLAKMVALCWLCYCAKYGKKMKYQELTKLYRVVEFVGKWSMVDVFVVSVLVGLVQIGSLVTVIPDIAIMAFMGVVIFTMLASHAFDPRLIWDKLET